MDKWILAPYEIDFDAGTATVLNINVETPYLMENAVYHEGNLMFYVNEGTVYDPARRGYIPPGPLPAGLYFLNLRTREQTETIRLLKR